MLVQILSTTAQTPLTWLAERHAGAIQAGQLLDDAHSGISSNGRCGGSSPGRLPDASWQHTSPERLQRAIDAAVALAQFMLQLQARLWL